jgi:hypothetical protein
MILFSPKNEKEHGMRSLYSVFTGEYVGMLLENDDAFAVIIRDENIDDILDEERR